MMLRGKMEVGLSRLKERWESGPARGHIIRRSSWTERDDKWVSPLSR